MITQKSLDAVVGQFEGVKALTLETVIKANGVIRQGVRIVLDETANPIVYIDDLEDAPECMAKLVERINGVLTEARPSLDFMSWDYSKVAESIIPQAINLANNVDFLKGKIFRAWEDIAIIYRLIVDIDDANGISSVVITTELAEQLGISILDLDAMAETYVEEHSNVISLSSMLGLGALDCGLTLISNEKCVFGAGVIGFEIVFDRLADSKKIPADCMVLPSSVHELIIVPVGLVDDAGDLASMVTTINAEQVQPIDRLTDSVYRYTQGVGLRRVQ